jgi:hypothetical protein
MILSDKLNYWIDLLNRKTAVRLLVLVAPGVIAHRAAGSLGLGTGPKMAAAVLMFVGLVIFASWGTIYKRLTETEEIEGDDADTDNQNEPEAISGLHHIVLMDELVLWTGSTDMALKRVHTELQVNPSLTYAAGIETAHRRLALERK